MRHWLFALLFLTACEKSAKKDKVPPPPDFIGVVSVKSLDAATARFAAYAEAVSPGAGAQIKSGAMAPALAAAVNARSVDGLALDKPIHLICLDPKKFARPFILVGSPSDQKKLTESVGAENIRVQGGRAMIGAKDALDASAAWAMASLTDAPAAPTVRLNLARLVERYRPEIEAFRGQMSAMFTGQSTMGKVLDVEIKLLLELAAQTEEVTAGFDAENNEASLELTFIPRAGSTLEVFGKAQLPASLDLLSRIPNVATAHYVLVGNYRLGAIRDVIYTLMAGILADMSGSPVDASFKKRWDAFLDHIAGPFAGAAWIQPGGKMTFTQLMAVDDGPKAVADGKALIPLSQPRTFDIMGIKLAVSLREGAANLAGSSIDVYSMRIDPDSLPAEQREMFQKMYGESFDIAVTGKDKILYINWGPSSAEGLGQVLSAAGGATPSPSAQAALTAALGRKASYVFFMDFAGVMGAMLGREVKAQSGVLMEMSFPDGASRMRIGLPAAHLKELTGIMGR